MLVIPSNYPKKMPFSKAQWESDFKYFSKTENQRVKGLGLPDKLEFKPADKYEMQEKPYFIALDTETFARTGNLICLCNSENEKVLYGNPNFSPSLNDYFNYIESLKSDSQKENVLFIVYNLKFDAQIILKSLGKKIISLYFGTTANGEKYTGTIDGLKIKYIPKKMLSMQSVKDKKRKVIIYDCMQFFLGSGIDKKSDLDSVAKKYLGQHKEYDGLYQDKVFPDKMSDLELAKIVHYCRMDCKLAKQVMDIWLANFFGAFSFYPQKYHSLGTIALEYLRTKMDYFPTFKYTPYAVHELAYSSYFGGRFEITERGTLEKIWHYDIRSAYPYAMAVMPDFTRGKWQTVKSLDQFKKQKENVGFYQISVTVNEKKIAPFMFRGKLGLVYCPKGTFTTHATADEIRVAMENYDCKIHKINGFSFVPESTRPFAFNNIVRDMYVKRMSQTNEGQKYIYKVIINSLYGKTAQANPEPRHIFNPVICSYITGKTRSMLLDAVKDSKDDVTQFATDAIFSRKKLSLPISDKLGDYEESYHPKVYVIMAGVYSYNTKEKPKMQTKSRGFELKTINAKGEKVVFDIENYDLKIADGKYFYEIKNRNAIPASKIAMNHNGYTPQIIGKMEIRKKEIDLNGDNKRLWSGYLKSVHDHNYSKPMPADLIF